MSNTTEKTENPKLQITDMQDGRTRLRIQFDITYKGHPGTTVEGNTHTEPDMTLTLGQLLERHSRGRDIPMKEPVYFEMEVPTFSDITDVERYKEQLQRRLKETESFIAQDKATAKEKKEAASKAQQITLDDAIAEAERKKDNKQKLD